MNRIYTLRLILFLSAAMMFPHISRASHSVGGDITYKCLGGNTYKVSLSFYRDCAGVAMPGMVSINVASASCGQSFTISCSPRAGTGQDITPTCPGALTTCNGGLNTGIQEWIYDGTVTLPQKCTDWMFSYQVCCRNAAITTISSPSTSTFYIYATLNNTGSLCNNSPTFSNRPVPFVCRGQQYCFNNGAFDADGDSLVYQLVAPYQNAATPVNYNATYSASQPVKSTPAVTFNSATGDICMNPQFLEVTVMAMRVLEYRNGVLIGSVERDLQITVLNCTNNLPTATGINGTNVFSTTVCANTQTCFTINSNDLDTAQQVSMSWNQTIPAATFTTSNAKHPVGTFCWTPGTADIGRNFHFTVRVFDDACPYVGSQIYSYNIYVGGGIAVNAGADQTVSCGGTATLTANTSGGSGSYSYLWNTGATTKTISSLNTGTYVVNVTDGQCASSDTVTVTSGSGANAAFTTSVPYCFSAPVNFTDQSIGTISSWQWNFGDATTSTSQNPSHQYASPGTYSIRLIIQTSSGCADTIIHTLNLSPTPVAAFTAPSVCAGVSACFTNQTTGTTAWHWNFGDNSSSASQNPCHTYTSAGTYSVTLTAGDSTSCPDSVKHIITINTAPVFNIAGNNVCIGNSTSLTANITSGNISTYAWNLGNSTSSASSNPSLTYSSSGTYTVSLTGTSSNGCTATTTTTAAVYALPTISAGADQSVCKGISATLNASAGPYSYLWTPGNFTTQSLSVNPTSTTSYVVSVTNINGCINRDTVQVIVNPIPTINAGADKSICSGSTVSISATGAVSYLWTPGGNTTSAISVSPSANTTYYVTGTNVSGCTSSDTVNVTINSSPTVSMTPKSICAGSSTTLDAGNTGSSYLWNTGASIQVISVSDSGNYSVVVTNLNGCSASGSVHVGISSSASSNPVNVSFCQGQSATLDAGNPGNTYLWSTGETTQTIIASAAGVYTVSVGSSLGCSSTFSDTVVVNSPPVVSFSTTSQCTGNPNSFVNSSTISSGSIASYSWNFGDASTSASSNPTHTYSTAGSYTVTLTAASSNGCTATSSIAVTVNPKPVASFSTNTVCLKQSTPFTDLSTISNGSIASTLWSFGDNSTSTVGGSHTYSSPGTYSVGLLVTSQYGCADSIKQTVKVNGLPVPSFTVSNVCQNSQLTIANNSSSVYGTISSVNWNFGNGATSSASNPNYTYTTSGQQNIQLVVTSSLGCSDTMTKQVQIYPLPVADFSPSKGCENQAVPFTNLSTVSQGSILSYTWNFGDGSTSNLTNPSHNYVTSSPFQVRLIATTNNGCRDTVIHAVTLYPVPVATFTTVNGCENTPLSFTDNSSVANGSIASWSWNFGDGSTSALASPSHQYTSAGSYNVNLTVTSANGCSAAVNASASVYPMPVPSFTSTEPCFGTPVQFYNQSTIPNGGQLINSWNFGNGNTTIPGNPTFSFASAGSYSVTLLVTSPKGCTDSVIKKALVHEVPIPDFSVVGQCLGKTTSFQDQSMSNDAPITKWDWQFGDGSSSAITLPDHNYSIDGDYPVKLTVTNANGCSSSITQQVSVNPNPNVIFTGGGQGCAIFNAHFKDSSSVRRGAITGWLWDFGDGMVSTDQHPQHDYMKSGSYPVTLTVETDHGCYSSQTKQGYVFAYPSPYADLNTDRTKANTIDPTFHFTNISQDYTTWQWNFGDGTTESNLLNPAHTYSDTGKYTVQLVVTNSYGCRDTVLQIVEIDPKSLMNIPNAFTPNDDGTNDVFKPYFAQMRDIEVQIYNRWGELIKDWHGLSGSWDGKFKGEPVQPDAYVYQIKGIGEDNKNYEWTGSVSVVR